jgi:hypothetical protein
MTKATWSESSPTQTESCTLWMIALSIVISIINILEINVRKVDESAKVFIDEYRKHAANTEKQVDEAKEHFDDDIERTVVDSNLAWSR